jgi:hypothetical protein
MTARLLALAVVAFALHFGWEMAHAKWYATMDTLPFWTATAWCARAALIDVAISAGAYAVAALVARSLRWVCELCAMSVAIYFAIGLAITVAIERWAVAVGRWRYASNMPTIGDVGVSPLLQWLIVPLLIAGAARVIVPRCRSHAAAERSA